MYLSALQDVFLKCKTFYVDVKIADQKLDFGYTYPDDITELTAGSKVDAFTCGTLLN
jgi:hypothetical protein